MIKWGTRSLDYSSCVVYVGFRVEVTIRWVYGVKGL